MKYLFVFISFLFSRVTFCQNPTQTENYLKTVTYTTPSMVTTPDKMITLVYYDGLGRRKQKRVLKGGGQGQDIVTPFVYDKFGREAKTFLPYANPQQTAAGSSAAYKDNNSIVIPALLQYYQNKYPAAIDPNAPNPFSLKKYDHSPLDRVVAQSAPGKSWAFVANSEAGHTQKMDYQTNVGNYFIKKFSVLFNDSTRSDLPTLNYDGYWQSGELLKTIIKNENWQPNQTYPHNHTQVVFKNFQNQVVLKRTFNKDQALDTYYVYDVYGNLTYVIPPQAISTIVTGNGGINPTVLHQLCYIFRYDHRNRVVEKKLPDREVQYLIYDRLDRVVATQDGNLRPHNAWLFTHYDAFNRPVYTGKYQFKKTPTQTMARKTLQTLYDQTAFVNEQKTTVVQNYGGTTLFYTHQARPNLSNSAWQYKEITLLSVNYYDTYSGPGWLSNLWPQDPSFLPANTSFTTKTQTLLTGKKVNVLNTSYWVQKVIHYDKKARPVYTAQNNTFLNTHYFSYKKLNFVGKPTKIKAQMVKGSQQPLTWVNGFTYDDYQRLLTQVQTLNGGTPQLIVKNHYNEVGQLVHKKVGGKVTALPENAPGLQTIDYAYNIRGWLTQLNNPNQLGNNLFGLKLSYDQPQSLGGVAPTALYNGNISQTRWKTANDPGSSTRAYTYEYDGLNRLTAAHYAFINAPGGSPTTSYSLNQVTYDKNGNILSLNRAGFTNGGSVVMDQLSYSYKPQSNRLQKVNDAGAAPYGFKDGNTTGNDYAYDPNGNLTQDLNKNLTQITYNFLNLPTHLSFANGNSISWVYTATGQKLQKQVTQNSTTTTQYAQNFIYKNGNLQFIAQPEGYIQPKPNGGFTYVFQYKDQLGNIRLSYADLNGDGTLQPTTEILDERNYYPFGMQHKGYNDQIISPKNNYQTFNGKELNEELGLNWLSYSARLYDPAIARWLSVDPLAGKFSWQSPYVFTNNNPINLIDPDGRAAMPPDDYYFDSQGNLTKVVKTKKTDRYYITDYKGNVSRLTKQGLGVVKNEKFEGFDANWQTNNSGFEMRLRDALKNYDGEPSIPFIKKESNYGGDLDQKLNLNPNKVYGFNGLAMNRNEAGNVVWGAALRVLGFGKIETFVFAHAGTLIIAGRLDEPDEVKAALMGNQYIKSQSTMLKSIRAIIEYEPYTPNLQILQGPKY